VQLFYNHLTDFYLDPVTSTIVHSSGTVVATCSGQRLVNDYGEGDSSSSDSESESESDSEESEASDSDGSRTSQNSSDHSSSVSSRHSNRHPKPTSRTLDNSIRVWSI